MEYKVLYRKYRPQNFDSLVGQDYTKTLLKNSIKNNKLSHAYIFTGPRGTGKTSSAKIYAKAINCLHPIDGNPCNECSMCLNFHSNPDVIELDAASNNGVDEIREIINNVRLVPSNSKYKVYIIDEFHMLSTSAFNALLLTLEEPPSNVVFILATTDIQSVPITVLSRCQRFDFRPICVEQIVNRLKYVCNEEKINISDDALLEIAYMSNGGMRDALSILDQISSRSEKITADDITANFGSISNKKVSAFIDDYLNGDINSLIKKIEEFKSNGIDIKILIEKIIDLLKNILLDIKLDKFSGSLTFDSIYNLVFDLNSILNDFKYSNNLYDLLEITFIKYFPGNNYNENVRNNNLNSSKNDKKETVIEKNNISEETESINGGILSFNVDARINNTFVNAKKTYLNELKQKWNDFVIYESNANKSVLSYVVDTEIVAASDNYAILCNKINSTNDLINQNIESIEKDFNIFFGKKYSLVSISFEKWEKEKEKYIKNLKIDYKYVLIDDKIIIDENKSELEKIALEIFGSNVEVQ